MAAASAESMTTLEALAAKKDGPMPTGKSWRGMPVPFFFREESAVAFGALAMRPDDVVCSSPVKGGTTWMHKIVTLMQHGLDDEGNKIAPTSPVIETMLSGQVYPDATPMEVPTEKQFISGMLSFPMLTEMPAPRLFTTHFYGEILPAELIDPAGKGRLIVTLRNPKDIVTSLHYFRGEAKDGWLGNEHGPGSLARFCSPACPNAYGSLFKWILDTERTIAPLVAAGRCIVVYFEELKLDLEAQLDRIAAFLSTPLTAAKRAALADAVSFTSMSGGMTSRKGEICDWKNHLDDDAWKLVDDAIAETGLATRPIYAPLAEYAMR